MLSPIDLLDIKPVWSSLIRAGRTLFFSDGLQCTPIQSFYTTFSNAIGRQIFLNIKSFVLSSFGMHIITPSFCVEDNTNVCFLNPSLSDLTTNSPICNQIVFKEFNCEAVWARAFFIVFVFFNAKFASSSEIVHSNELRSSTFTVGISSTIADISQYPTALSVYKFW